MRLYGAVLTVFSVKSVAAGCGWIVMYVRMPFLIVTSIEVIALSISQNRF